MLSRSSKNSFYCVASPLMRLNAFIYKYLRSFKPRGTVRVHLGPGQEKYLSGWINIDANMFTGKCDVWADLRHPLPFHNSTVDAVYSHHMIEHLPDISGHFRDVFRCLKPGAIYRVGGPDGDNAIKKFVEGDKRWFGDWPEKRHSIGGRFENFIFCRGEHLTILTYSFLEELLVEAGFIQVRKCIPAQSTYAPEIFADCLRMEHESDFESPHTLIVEALRPTMD